MADRRTGTISHWRQLSPLLAVFRLQPAPGCPFPDYKGGQYIALRRDDCRLTRKVVDDHGQVRYLPELDEMGRQKRGPVTHSYSISSAPFETRRDGHLEFYVVLEVDSTSGLGRLTEALFALHQRDGAPLDYVDRIAGDFTLDKRAAGFESVLLVGTGTGLAPFASMVKQLDHEAAEGKRPPFRLTLLHANRTRQELAYHEELCAIEGSRRFDFVYLPSLSRVGGGGPLADGLATGRANNLLRLVFEMPLREEEDGDGAALARVVRPALPRGLSREPLRKRLDPAKTVVLTCGNASSMGDIKRIAEALEMRFEKEDWKPASRAEQVGRE